MSFIPSIFFWKLNVSHRMSHHHWAIIDLNTLNKNRRPNGLETAATLIGSAHQQINHHAPHHPLISHLTKTLPSRKQCNGVANDATEMTWDHLLPTTYQKKVPALGQNQLSLGNFHHSPVNIGGSLDLDKKALMARRESLPVTCENWCEGIH